MVLAVGLVVATFFYVAFATVGASASWVGGELLGVAAYGLVVWQGARGSAWWLVAGWALHPVWDVALHLVGAGSAFTPEWYAVSCITFDLLVGGYAAWRFRGAPAPRGRHNLSWRPRMKLKAVLAVSALYLGVLGLGFMFAPRQIGIDAVPVAPSPALIAYLRLFGGPFLGIAVLNWLARDAEPSTARNAIILANIVGFGCATCMDIWGVFSGDARQVAKVFLGIHLLLTVAFIVAGRASLRDRRR